MRVREISHRAISLLVTTAALAGAPMAASLAHADTTTASGSGTAATATAEERADVPCDQFLPPNHLYRTEAAGEAWWTYKMDSDGRPLRAQTQIGALGPEDDAAGPCAAKVAAWGGPGQTGVRLIPSVLKGTGRRNNLVSFTPSAESLVMKAMANAAKRCATTPHYLVKYTATAHYDRNSFGIAPESVTMRMDMVTPAGSPTNPTVRLKVDNKKYTKTSASTLTDKLAEDVKAAGCAAG